MGGKAFTSGPTPLFTPRMPPELYYRLRDHYISLLSTYYTQAATPIEAPCKTSYGDIDVLVCQPKSISVNTDTLAKVLDAVRKFSTPGSLTASFAVPYPGLQDTYVQLDVHVCPPGLFEWQLFHQSHGDLWNLLGTTIRPVGLTANDVGLHVRVPEIEEVNRKRGMLFLTSEPDQVLDFLGQDRDKYERPFESVEALYHFVLGCRWFDSETYVRTELKANDRKRMAQRELYRRFVDEWLPENKQLVKKSGKRAQGATREDVQESALIVFGKREEYDKRVQEWRRERSELLEKQERRLERRADAAKLEEYAEAWMNWLERGRPVL